MEDISSLYRFTHFKKMKRSICLTDLNGYKFNGSEFLLRRISFSFRL